ncbi:G patch domain-containing protein TGH homolog [Phoenix dactylifera]|uniref:G patch domain-containing protein TGH homolog n=1 Tax=Phoenix dactylifera TaxID=42345 RepID=A0A8B9AB97_PHODC|nr:G patch domain-containing protein TGH homolog [Phoenix dactylifera]XP_038982997.1 G patch domain-containing protein TGH homolog [Phoenix dactylifera]
MDEDEEDYLFYGTPIEREEETSARKRKAVADAGQLRTLPQWKQEVRDEEGRRRFHGAFTGGFSAGYYNTVGSKEGWTPQTFTSSRKNRAEVKQQTIYNFFDEDDIKGMGGHALETSLQFDTFGFTAAEFARKKAEKEQQKRPSAIPGPVPDEIVLPAANSIGIKLLQKMGWRHGHSIKDTHTDSLYEARREARKAFLAFSGNDGGPELAQNESSRSDSEECSEKCKDGIYASQNTPMYVLHPKLDLHGLGYDPFKHAPEFRDRKTFHESKNKDRHYRSDVSMKGNLLASNSGKYAPGFGIGALEELDIEDEDIYASGFDFEQTEVEEVEPSRIIRHNKYKLEDKKQGVLPGFKVASISDYNVVRFLPPVIPADFEPYHKFPTPLEMEDKLAELPPPEVPPPEDNNLRLSIEGLATLVARYGKHFEDLSKEKHRSNPLFSFLNGGNGHSYYARKLWEEKQKKVDQRRMEDVKSKSSVQTMTADSRGRILGEKPLERSSSGSSSSTAFKEVVHFQSNLSDTFTKPNSLVESSESVKPFKNDPAKQERFEYFLKDKYEGGLRSTQALGSSIMSEADRARERLDFEAAAEAIEKGKGNTKICVPSTHTVLPGLGEQFFIPSTGVEKHDISQDEEKIMNKFYPKREEFQWRPTPILCKRFDIVDPFMGKPPPLPRPRSKMETLIFMTESLKSSKTEETSSAARDSKHISLSEVQEVQKQPTANEPDIEPSTTTVQRPVDLYKAIFSDESDDDVDGASPSQVVDPASKNEGANTTLNRLIAGDFLESLGKELGLEVPPDRPCQPYKANSSTLTENASMGDLKIPSTNEKSTSTFEMPKVLLENKDEACKPWPPENGKNSASASKAWEIEVPPFNGDGHGHCSSSKDSFNICLRSGVASGRPDVKNDKVQVEKDELDAKISRSHSKYRRSRSSSPDTDSCDQHWIKKSRTHSRHHRGRSKTPDTDSSSDQHRSRKNRTHSRHHPSRSRTPDTDYYSDQNKAKHSRTQSRHRHRSTTPDIDSSSDCRYRDLSRSGVEKCSPQGKRKKRSRHHKHKRRSPDRYASRDNDRDLTDDSRKDRKSGDRGRHSAKSKSDSHRNYR